MTKTKITVGGTHEANEFEGDSSAFLFVGFMDVMLLVFGISAWKGHLTHNLVNPVLHL